MNSQEQNNEQQPQMEQSHHSHHHQQEVCNDKGNQQCTFCPQTFAPTQVYASSPYRYVNQPATLISSQVVQQQNQSTYQNLKGESRVEYFPIERREIEYKQVEEVVTENIEQNIVEYQEVERKYIERVPKEVTRTDYQAIEYQKEYVPRVQYETVEEKVPVTKVQYVPVTRIEYVPQEKTEYITQSRQVERVEYDEIEYQVQRPQVVQQQPMYSQVLQQPVTQSVHASHHQLSQSQQVVQQPVQYVQQPVQYAQSGQWVYQSQIPAQYYVPQGSTVIQQTQPVHASQVLSKSQQIAKNLVKEEPKKEKGFIERLFS